ncbi:unnamed protein product [Musa acuminata subsp. burmannicoides]
MHASEARMQTYLSSHSTTASTSTPTSVYTSPVAALSLQYCTTSASALQEDPSLPATACAAACFSSPAFSLAFFPASPSISSLATSATSSLRTSPLPSAAVLGRSATPRPSAIITAFIRCSAYSGHAMIGTPWTKLSSNEFQPQWVRKPPVAAWASTSTWGTHSGTTSPAPRETLRQVAQRVVRPLQVEEGPASHPVAGAPHHPEKPPPARLQPPRQLLYLLRREGPPAPERDKQHRPGRLLVQPPQALLPLRATVAAAVYHRPDCVDVRPPHLWLRLLEGRVRRRLQVDEAVHEDAVHFPDTPGDVQHASVGVVGPVLHRVQEVLPSEWDAAREHHRFRQVPVLARRGLVQRREVQQEGQHHEAGGEEKVVRHPELLCHGEGLAAEEVDDVSGEAGGPPQGAEDVADVGNGALHHDAEARLDMGIRGDVVEGEGGKDDVREAGREGVEEGGLGVVGEVGEDDEGGGEAVAEDKELGELREGDEVAHAGAGHDGYVRRSSAASLHAFDTTICSLRCPFYSNLS